MSLNNTVTTTETHFDYASRLRDLDEAVLLARTSLELQIPPNALHSESLDNLADALLTRFQDGGQRDDLDEAISLYRQTLELRPSPGPLRPYSLNTLSKVLLIRFLQGGQPSDLDEAILLPKQALELQSPTHPLLSSSLHNLALALCRRFEITGQQSDLNESISLHRQALKLQSPPQPSRSASLSDLAIALFRRFGSEGRSSDLGEALSLHRQALELRTSPHPDRCKSLNNLAATLWTQFEQEGRQSDLDEAIFLYRQVLELRPSPHPYRSISLNNIAGALITKFEQRGHQSDLDEAILLHRQALELRPSPHPLRARSLNNLSNALKVRFHQEDHQCDIDEAILLQRQALELRPSPHVDRINSLNNLATALWRRFDKDGHQCDLDEAMSLHRQVLELHPLSNPVRSQSLNNLATALKSQFEKAGQQTDLDEAILLYRQALDLRALSHPLRSQSLNNLGNVLQTRFETEGQQTDLNEAILLYRQALDLRPSPHADRSQSLYDLGNALIFAHSVTGNNSDYLDEAMELFSAATQCLNQPAPLRRLIARTWIKHAVLYRHMSAMDSYDAALQGLPKLAALSFNVKSRQEALLTDSDGLAQDASRFAIRAGKVDKAIEFLEAGRAVFWSQFLSLRSPLGQLREILPALADQLRDIATSLELGSHRNTLADTSENWKKLAIDQETARLNRLHEEWSKAIDDVRQLNGFEDFLRPRSLSELQVAASDGPVIILIGNDDGSDILVLTSAHVCTIHLSDLPNQELQNLVHLIRLASPDSRRSHIEDFSGNTGEFPLAMVNTLRNWMKLKEERGMRYEGQKDSDTLFRFVLEIIWVKVVRPASGLLLICSRSRSTAYSKSHSICGIIQNDGCNPISRTGGYEQGAENIEKHISNDFLVKLGIPGVSTSVEAVASQLSNVDIVHFSCHGTQNRSNPLDSGLKLEDGYLCVSRIMKEKIPNGALAFLCACETAMGDGKLPDEAMSLGASLLFSGFRRVVATMWAMLDADGPVVADAFYKELFRGPDGKPTREPDANKYSYLEQITITSG